MSIRRVASGAVIYITANLLNKGTIIISVPIFTRLMNPSDYGRWALVLGSLGILSILFDLGISRSVPRFYFENEENATSLRNFFSMTLALRFTTSAIMTLLFLALAPTLLPNLSKGVLTFSSVGIPIVLYAVFESLTQLVLAFLRAAERPFQFLTVRMLSLCVQLCLALLFANTFADSVSGAAWGYALGTLIGAIFSFALILRDSRYRFRFAWSGEWRTMIKFGLPLIFHDLGAWLRSSADSFVLVQFLGLTAVSTYSLGMMSGLAISMLAASVDMAYVPVFYRMLRDSPIEGRHRNAVISEAYSLTMAGAILIPVLFSGELYRLIAPSAYLGAARYAPMIATAFYFFVQYTIFVKPVLVQKKTYALPFITLLPSGLAVLANYLLVPHFGLLVPPITWAVAFFVMCTVAYLYGRRVDHLRFRIGSSAIAATILCLLSVPPLFWPTLPHISLGIRISFIFGIFLLIAWRLCRSWREDRDRFSMATAG